MTSPLTDYFVHPFPNPDLADGFGSTGYWEGGKYVHRASPHRGLDYPQAGGTPIPATAAGTVVAVFWSDALGHVTVIQHHRPGGAPTVYSGYCHQTSQAVHLEQTVSRGQIIGTVGETGSEASGSHLHFTMSHHLHGVTGPDANFNPALFIEHNSKAAFAVSAAQARYVKVRTNDSLSKIGGANKVPLSTMKQLNPQVHGPDFVIHPGDRIRVK